MKLTVGSDPEVVVYNKETNKPVSAITLFEDHSKYNPISKGKNRNYYYDNVNVEGTINPASSKAEFVESIRDYVQDLRAILGEQFTIKNESYTVFPANELDSPEAMSFGCSPALDAFTCEMIEREQAFNIDYRVCGGHIHIGFENAENVSFDEKVIAIKLSELIIGTSLTVVDNDPSSSKRKQLYGKAGESRFPSYGVEIRSPGNYWLGSPELVELVWDLTELTHDLLVNNMAGAILSKINEQDYIEAINTFDKQKCLEIIKSLNLLPDAIINKIIDLSQKVVKIEENWN